MTPRPNLKELSKTIFEDNKKKGFHEEEYSNEHYLMLVITELSEAIEADRKGKQANLSGYTEIVDGYTVEFIPITFEHAFKTHIKDSVADELADAVIRLLDLAGLRGYSEMKNILLASNISEKKSFTENIFSICKEIAYYKYSDPERISFALLNIEALCQDMNIDLWLHVDLKLKYNRTRAYKRGKEY